MLALAVERDAERFEQLFDGAGVEIEPTQAFDDAEIELEGGVSFGRLAGDIDLARLTPTQVEHVHRGKIEPRHHEIRIDAALEPEARVRLDVEPASGAGGALRIEIGGLDEDIGGGLGDPGIVAAHHPAKPEHFRVVGDDAHVLVDRVGLAVEREEALAFPPEPRRDDAFNLVGVIDMQRAGAVERDVVGDVDQRIDGAQADRLEPMLQPFRARTVLDIAHEAPDEDGAGRGGPCVELKLDWNRVGEDALDWLGLVLSQPAEACGGKIAGDAAHAEAIGPVRRDGDFDHCIVEAERGGRRAADLGVGRKLDDTGVLVGQLELALRQQHAVGLDAPNLRLGERQVDAGNVAADRREHAFQPGARVRRSAHDLQTLGAGIDLAHLELIGVRVLRRAQHLRHRERRERGRGVEHLLDLEPDAGERLGDLVHLCHGVEMLLEPAKREFHDSPPARVGMARGGKP